MNKSFDWKLQGRSVQSKLEKLKCDVKWSTNWERMIVPQGRAILLFKLPRVDYFCEEGCAFCKLMHGELNIQVVLT